MRMGGHADNAALRYIQCFRENDWLPEFDLVVRGGTVADGTGGVARSRYCGEGRKIVAVGQGSATGARRSTPRVCWYAAGSVDIHTPMTARRPGIRICSRRVAWRHHGGDGQCGVGFAPVKVEDRQADRLMEGVEESRRRPRRSLNGVGSSFGQYSTPWSAGRATWTSARSCRTARCVCL